MFRYSAKTEAETCFGLARSQTLQGAWHPTSRHLAKTEAETCFGLARSQTLQGAWHPTSRHLAKRKPKLVSVWRVHLPS